MDRHLLVVIAGRPGTGKTTLGRLLAGQVQAAYLRTDVIVGPILRGGLTSDDEAAADVGYDVAREIALENLRAGVPVVVDGVHATHARRSAWHDVADAAEARIVFLETTLVEVDEHRRRVQERQDQVDGYLGPSWPEIQTMTYAAWNVDIDGSRMVVEMSDTDAALVAVLGQLDLTRAG